MLDTAHARKSHNVYTHVLNSTAPHAASIDGYIFSSTVNGRDVLEGPDILDLDAQVSAAFSKVEEVLAEAGGTLDDVALLSIGMADYDGVKAAVIAEWDRRFPGGQGPVTHLLVPQGGFPKPNTFLGIQFVARIGYPREVIVLDSQPRTGNFPHAVVLGDFVTNGPIEDADAVKLFEQLETRLEAAGSCKDELGYVRTYARGASGKAAQLEAFKRCFAEKSADLRPALQAMVLTELPDDGSSQISHAFAVRGSQAVGTTGRHVNGGARVARRGQLFFSGGINGLGGEARASADDPEKQGEQFYAELRARLDSIGARHEDLVKVNMWINSKAAKTLALVGWKQVFGTIEEGAREKTPGRTFLIHAQPAMDEDVLIEAEIIGVLPPQNR